MYLHDTVAGENSKEFCQVVLQMEPGEIDLDAVSRIEIYATSINDAGDDYCEFRFIDRQNKVMKVRREMGY